MEMVAVSVVIPTFNRGHLVREAVDSALAQTYRDAEVLVVDDGSTDNTPEVLEPYRGRIHYIRQENKGVSAARNTGIRQARGSYIAILDSDDQWVPEKLEAQMALFAADPSLGLVSCGSSFVDVYGKEIETPKSATETHDTDSRLVLRRLLLGNFVSGGSNAVIRKDCFDAVGVFDESLSGVEDWDMWLRIAKRYPIGFVNRPLTITRVSPTSLSAPTNVDMMLTKEFLVVEKHCSDASSCVGAYDRGRAYSERYGRAAWAYLASGDLSNARQCILRALVSNPVHFTRQRQFVGLLIRILVGDRMFTLLRRITPKKETK